MKEDEPSSISGWVMIAAFVIVSAAAGYVDASTLECNSTTLVEIMQGEECPDCPPIPDCPPVLACNEGYTAACVKDDIVIPPGEQQQYPAGNTEDFVQAVTGGGLVDIALNDSRWGDREEGNVYARENEDFITWYWPTSGAATFDPTRIGNTAAWYDYRTASDVAGGGPNTSLPITVGMSIYFGDNGGGVSIFQRKVGPPIDPPNGDFLATYTNPEQANVPADGVYPFGQRMWMSMYSNSKSELARMNAAGMTLSGPHYHGCSEYDYPPDIAETNRYGMKMYWRLYIGSGGWRGIVDKMKTAEGRTTLSNKVKRCINAVLSDPVRNNVVAAWYGHEEEPFTRTNLPISGQREYMKMVRDIIAANDPKKRPYFVSERTDSGASSMTGNAAYTAGVMKQNYLMKSNDYDYQGQEMNERFLIGQWVRDQFQAAKNSGASYTGKLKPVIATLSMYIDPDDASLRNGVWLRKAITHDFYLSIAMGAHGVNTYTWASNFSTRKVQSDLYLEVMGDFSNNGLQQVFLWGDNRDDVKINITAGPKTFQWNKYNTTYTEPSIKFRNIQYGDNRYILLVNSAKESVTLTLTGIPALLTMTEMITGSSRTTDNVVSLTIEPLGVRMYKVSK